MERFIAEALDKTKGKAKDERTSRNGYLPEPRKLSAKRVKNILGTLHTILASAVEWCVLDKLPRFPQIRCSLPSFDFYDASEVAALVDSARDDERILILLAGHTGARACRFAGSWGHLAAIFAGSWGQPRRRMMGPPRKGAATRFSQGHGASSEATFAASWGQPGGSDLK